MKISYNWLKSYVKTELSHEKVAEILTDIGLEVEGVITIGNQQNTLETVLVGKVESVQPHPNADRLKLTTIHVGEAQPLQIVCGAPNIAEGQKVPVATIGTVLFDASGKDFKIKKSKIRGEESFGMICSEVELGLGSDNSGILELNPTLKVGTPLSELYQQKEDHVFEIGLTPNRSDAMSHYGVARDLFAALQTKKLKAEFSKLNLDDFKPDDQQRENPIEVIVENAEKAPRYCGVTLENIQIKESPDWLKNRLLSIGLTPKNNVVDITNFVLHNLGQPLHAFDADKVLGNKVIVKTLEKGTKFITLDEKERELSDEDLMICNQEKGMCIAGVLGGIESGVTENTTRVFLESAYFNPVSIRKTAKLHTINTDASFRFERQTDPNACLDVLKYACILLHEYANAEIIGEVFDFYPNEVARPEVVFRCYRLDQIAGQKIHREQIKQILKYLEIEVESEHNDTYTLKIPTYRADVLREIDVIEEVLRIYGFNNIITPEKVSFSVASAQHRQPIGLKENKVSDILVADGFFEAMNNSLTKKELIEWFPNQTDVVEILNPLSNDLSVMRQSLLFGLLENLSFNANRNHADLKLFEFGKSYAKYQDKYHEEMMLGLLVSGNQTEEHWAVQQQPSSFFHLKGYVQKVLQLLNITIHDEIALEDAIFSDGILLMHNEVPLVKLGKVHPKLLKAFSLNQEVFFASFYWDKILPLSNGQHTIYKEIPKYPGAKRDLALLIDTDKSYIDFYQLGFETEQNLIKSIQLFDVYEGDKLPKGKKSYALSFFLQKENETITDTEIEQVMASLIDNYKTKLNAELRN